MQDFLLDEFDLEALIVTVYCVLKQNNWSCKKVTCRAAEQTESLCSVWIGRLVMWEAHMLVFVDESGVYEQTGDQKYSWSPQGLIAIEVGSIKCSQR
jgi:hypothetical protein